ncbi:MAG: thiamine-phosphate kinase [Zavarzinella sp.]
MGSELDFISWLSQQQCPTPDVIVGIGDDAAVVRPMVHGLVCTTDMLMEGSCFLLHDAGPYRVGQKAIHVNLSDLAAMLAIPKYVLISLGIPRSFSLETIKNLYLGMKNACNHHDVVIIGGDTNSWEGPLTISVTALGEAPAGGSPLRSHAQVGDGIFVTGPLGGSILGHHLDFQPKTDWISFLRQHPVRGMLDISDGLACDLLKICQASHVGAELFAQQIPITLAAKELAAKTGKTSLEHALHDGEDFELLFTIAQSDIPALVAAHAQSPLPPTLFRIGEIVANGFWLKNENSLTKLSPHGYEHLFGENAPPEQ